MNIQLSKNDILWIEIYKQGTRKQIKQDKAVFTFVFPFESYLTLYEMYNH